METKDFLFEIGCEELPTHSLLPLVESLRDNLKTAFDKAQLPHSETQVFVTPRRFAVLVPDLASTQPARTVERQGPSIKDAYDSSGTPTLACIGFARSCGVSVDQLEVQKTEKGERVFCRAQRPGSPTQELLPEIIEQAFKQLNLRKTMRWGAHRFQFIRPIHWVVAMYGKEVIPIRLFNTPAGCSTYGHRFHHPKPIQLTQPKDYNVLLYQQGYVVADFETRKRYIAKKLNETAGSHQALVDEDLLNEATALVEWPVILQGNFDQKFLEVPREALITCMQTHQKCFAVEDSHGKLLPHFLMVSNIESKDPQAVIAGNQRVIRARLSDASFFYHNDKNHSLESRLERLTHVVFQNKLGTVAQKSERITQLASMIAKQTHADTAHTQRAASLCKADLVSEMVYEFPSLQGTMGYYYALNDKEDEAVAVAIKEHYLPRFSGDHLPQSLPGACVALADRLDTLVGIIGINKTPTSDKDPYALRRAALGILRILIEKRLSLDLLALLESAQKLHTNLENSNVVDEAFDFLMGRLKALYYEQGVSPEVFEAVYACKPTTPLDFDQRVKAVRQFQTLPEASALAAANKRVSNILKKVETKLPDSTNAKLFEADEEKQLANCIASQSKVVDSLYQQADYTQALSELSSLKEPIDAFFDQVMVMDKDENKRNNRLALLVELRHLFTQVADISLLP